MGILTLFVQSVVFHGLVLKLDDSVIVIVNKFVHGIESVLQWAHHSLILCGLTLDWLIQVYTVTNAPELARDIFHVGRVVHFVVVAISLRLVTIRGGRLASFSPLWCVLLSAPWLSRFRIAYTTTVAWRLHRKVVVVVHVVVHVVVLRGWSCFCLIVDADFAWPAPEELIDKDLLVALLACQILDGVLELVKWVLHVEQVIQVEGEVKNHLLLLFGVSLFST